MTDKSYFRSSGFVKESEIYTELGTLIDLKKVPPFLRTLLVTDGTVTKSLEAWFWERIKIHPISNSLEVMKDGLPGLEVSTGDKVLHREVILKGVESGTNYACARSNVSLKHLPKEIGDALEKGEIGIGELLREEGVETYRDIFNINYLSTLPPNDKLLSSLPSEVLLRSYRIRVNGCPAIVVTEYFPVSIFKP